MPVSRHRHRYSRSGAIEHFRAIFYNQGSGQFIQTINECLFGLLDGMKIVTCMALTRQSPSRTPLFATNASTVEVIFTNPRRSGTSNQRYSVSDVIVSVIVQRTVCRAKSFLVQCGATWLGWSHPLPKTTRLADLSDIASATAKALRRRNWTC
jgi:hypothetical protein